MPSKNLSRLSTPFGNTSNTLLAQHQAHPTKLLTKTSAMDSNKPSKKSRPSIEHKTRKNPSNPSSPPSRNSKLAWSPPKRSSAVPKSASLLTGSRPLRTKTSSDYPPKYYRNGELKLIGRHRGGGVKRTLVPVQGQGASTKRVISYERFMSHGWKGIGPKLIKKDLEVIRAAEAAKATSQSSPPSRGSRPGSTRKKRSSAKPESGAASIN
jgi:hypothetical protein